MEKDNRELTEEFIRYEKTRGVRSLRKIPYELKPFFTYLENENLDLKYIGIRDAQEFQTYLATMRNSEGNMDHTKFPGGTYTTHTIW